MSPFAGKFIEFSEEEFAGSIGIKEFIKRLGIAFKALVKAAARNEVEKVVDLSEGITLKCSYKNGKYTYTFTDEKGREKTFEDHIPQDFNFIEWAHGIPSKITTHSEEEDFAKTSKSQVRKSAEGLLTIIKSSKKISPEDLAEVSKLLNRISKELNAKSKEQVQDLKTMHSDEEDTPVATCRTCGKPVSECECRRNSPFAKKLRK